MSTLAASTNHTASGSSLIQAQIDGMTAALNTPLHLEKERETLQERAMRHLLDQGGDAMLMDPSNPTMIENELELQKAYFRRLKFTYLEQEAKRNFLYSIMGDEPKALRHGENEALEASNAEVKAGLKAYKAQVNDWEAEGVALAKKNADRYPTIRADVAEIASLQKQIRDAELELARIRATHPPETRLTLDSATTKLDDQTVEMQDLQETLDDSTRRVEQVREQVARTTKEVAKLAREREREEARAKEVREGREAGDGKVDELCRWLSSSIQFYRSLLGISSVSASVAPGSGGKQHLLHITYDIPDAAASTSPAPLARDPKSGKAQAELVLAFDATTRLLLNAQLTGAQIDIEEITNIAVVAQDVPALVGDVLNRLRPIGLGVAPAGEGA